MLQRASSMLQSPMSPQGLALSWPRDGGRQQKASCKWMNQSAQKSHPRVARGQSGQLRVENSRSKSSVFDKMGRSTGDIDYHQRRDFCEWLNHNHAGSEVVTNGSHMITNNERNSWPDNKLARMTRSVQNLIEREKDYGLSPFFDGITNSPLPENFKMSIIPPMTRDFYLFSMQ